MFETNTVPAEVSMFAKYETFEQFIDAIREEIRVSWSNDQKPDNERIDRDIRLADAFYGTDFYPLVFRITRALRKVESSLPDYARKHVKYANEASEYTGKIPNRFSFPTHWITMFSFIQDTIKVEMVAKQGHPDAPTPVLDTVKRVQEQKA